MNDAKIRVGVVGVGRMGDLHLQKFLKAEDCEVVGFAETNPERIAAVSQKYSIPHFSRAAELFFEADAIVVACSTAHHFAVAKGALEAGLPTLIEKPIASTVEEASVLVELARAKAVPLQVGFVERYRLQAFQQAWTLTGRIVSVELERLATTMGREPEVDVIADLMTHDLDLLFALLPFQPQLKQAWTSSVITPYADEAFAAFRFPDGELGTIRASRVSPVAKRRCRIVMTDGVVELDFGKNTLLQIDKQGRISEQTLLGVDPLYEQARAFCHAARSSLSPVVTGQDGLRALLWISSVREQGLEARRTVAVPAPLARELDA